MVVFCETVDLILHIFTVLFEQGKNLIFWNKQCSAVSVVSVEAGNCDISTDELRIQQRVVKIKPAVPRIDEVHRVNWIKVTLRPINTTYITFSANDNCRA